MIFTVVSPSDTFPISFVVVSTDRIGSKKMKVANFKSDPSLHRTECVWCQKLKSELCCHLYFLKRSFFVSISAVVFNAFCRRRLQRQLISHFLVIFFLSSPWWAQSLGSLKWRRVHCSSSVLEWIKSNFFTVSLLKDTILPPLLMLIVLCHQGCTSGHIWVSFTKQCIRKYPPPLFSLSLSDLSELIVRLSSLIPVIHLCTERLRRDILSDRWIFFSSTFFKAASESQQNYSAMAWHWGETPLIPHGTKKQKQLWLSPKFQTFDMLPSLCPSVFFTFYIYFCYWFLCLSYSLVKFIYSK